MQQHILVVDDEADICLALGGLLEDENYLVTTANSGPEALDLLGQHQFDLVLLDIWMDGMDGLEVLSRIKRRIPDLPVIMISGHGTIETAVQATQKGAYDFIEKPPQAERLLLTISRAIREHQLRRENLLLRARGGTVSDLLGSSSQIAAVRHLVRQVAATESRPFLTGESGVGKEIVARLIHQLSSRKDKPFVILSPGAVSESTLDSALSSLLDQGAGGTLFLDEVTDLTPVMQGRILRFLHDGVVGDGHGQARPADVRVISASTREVKELVEGGQFRSELYYRLNVVPIAVPPLRERRQDIPSLVDHFLETIAVDADRRPRILPATMAVLTSYGWPGNVRQLRNLVEWLAIIHPGAEVTPEMLPGELRQGEVIDADLMVQIVDLPLRDARELFEKNYLSNQLKRFGGNISRTADFVGMERSALHRKLRSLGVEARLSVQ